MVACVSSSFVGCVKENASGHTGDSGQKSMATVRIIRGAAVRPTIHRHSEPELSLLLLLLLLLPIPSLPFLLPINNQASRTWKLVPIVHVKFKNTPTLPLSDGGVNSRASAEE